MTHSLKASSNMAPLAVLMLVTFSMSGCGTSDAIRSDSSPSFAAVEAALARTGVELCDLRLSSGGTYCDRHTAEPSEGTVYSDIPASFFTFEVDLAKIPHNSVWANGRTIVSIPGPSQTVVTALEGNGFKWLTTGRVTFHSAK